MGCFSQHPISLFSIHKTLLRHSFILGSRTPIVSIRINRNATTRSKDTRHLNILRVHQADKVFHYDIHAIFMESTMIPEAEKIEFQALAFHHFNIRNIADTDFCKISLPGYGK